MDINKIPKFLIWVAILVFVILVLYNIYGYFFLGYIPVYAPYLSVDCKYSQGYSVVIISAKQNLHDIVVYSIDSQDSCSIKSLDKGSQDICYVKNKEIGKLAYVKIEYSLSDGERKTSVVECKVVGQSLISRILSAII